MTAANGDCFDGHIAEKATDTHASTSNTRVISNQKSRISQLSSLIKILAFLLLAAVIAVVVLAVLLVEEKNDNSDHESSTRDESTQVCTTANCLNTAAGVRAKMDLNVDPCDDFYQFACGSWMLHNVIPEDGISVDSQSLLRDEALSMQIDVLEAEITADDPAYIRKAKDYFSSCTNTDVIETKGDRPLKELLNKQFGGWPILSDSWDDQNFDLAEMTAKINELNKAALVKLTVDGDANNRRVLNIDRLRSGMPTAQYYLVPRNDSKLMAYQNLIYSTALLLGANKRRAEEDAIAIVDFEIELAKISVTTEDRWDTTTLKGLHDKHKEQGLAFDWKSYFQRLAGLDGLDLTVSDEEVIVNRAPLYFDSLMTLLRNTKKRVQANYLVWRGIQALFYALPAKFRKINQDYEERIKGTKKEQPRSVTCYRGEDFVIWWSVASKLFLREKYNTKIENESLHMIDNLQKSFDSLLDELDWLDEETRQLAKEKNNAMRIVVGYEGRLSDEVLTSYYERFNYTPEDYLNNKVHTKLEYLKSILGSLRGGGGGVLVPSLMPQIVNGFYSNQVNKMSFAAAFLQPPMLSLSYPKSMNYGGIGYFMGHEITHGFDNEGRKYDKDGRKKQWWSQSAIDEFKAREKCLIDQYNNFTVEQVNMNVNGILTLGENIADNGGIRQSFKAYRTWVASKGKEEMPLPGLEFTHNQLFFISFAQVLCSKMRNEEMTRFIRQDAHSPPPYRVIGPLQNSPDFSEAFKCQSGSPMNRKDKCRIW